MKIARWVGILALIVGLGLIGNAVWEVWGTDVLANSQNDRDTAEVEQQWSEQTTPDPAKPHLTKNDKVLIKIPKFGEKYKWIIQSGTTTEDLHHGPGHYVNSGELGKPGNYALAGHRTTYGAPFKYLDELRKDDEIRLETWNKIYIYAVTSESVVDPKDVFVLEPTEDATITLTTCHPEFSSRERLIVKGELVETIAKG